MELDKIIAKYISYKEILNAIQEGNWNKPEIQNLTVEQIENMMYIVHNLSVLGFEKAIGVRAD